MQKYTKVQTNISVFRYKILIIKYKCSTQIKNEPS